MHSHAKCKGGTENARCKVAQQGIVQGVQGVLSDELLQWRPGSPFASGIHKQMSFGWRTDVSTQVDNMREKLVTEMEHTLWLEPEFEDAMWKCFSDLQAVADGLRFPARKRGWLPASCQQMWHPLSKFVSLGHGRGN